MIMRMWKVSKKIFMEPKYECVDHLRSVVRPDADGHAGFDFARPDRTGLPVHDDHGTDRIGRAETVYRYREVRNHGDPVLYPGRQLSDARRRGPAHDQLRHVDGRSLAWRVALGGVMACALFAAVS